MISGAPQQLAGNTVYGLWAMRLLVCILAVVSFLAVAPAVEAQTVNQYTNSTDSANGAITGAQSCTVGVTFQRDIFVSDDFSVQDVNLGVLMSHNTRSEYALFLRSPAGNIVTLKNLTGGNADNFNVLFDDQNVNNISGHSNNDTATVTTSVPPYQRTFAPSNSMNATFVGQSSFGTWTLFACDFSNNGVNGTFYQMDLYLTTPPPSADLSLAKTVASSSPSTAVYTLSVTNSAGSALSTSGVTVRDILPAGVSFVSASGTGTYNNGTGIWTLGTSIAPGQTVSIDLAVNITAASGTTITNTAQIMTSSATDPDSTPGNGNTTEDDYASRSFTVGGRIPGYIPPLSNVCPAINQRTFSWASPTTWSGANPHNYPVTDVGTIGFSVTPPPNGFANATPAITTDNSGGGPAGTRSLYFFMNNGNETHTSSTTLNLPTAVPGLQFTIFDIDYAANQFTDMVTVTGTYNGATVLPTLSNNTANYVSGNSVIGDGASGATEAFGNVVVTFTSPVDSVTVVYGNYLPTTPTSSGNQAMSIHDFTFCKPTTTLSVTKISSVVSDPVNGTTNPKAIPGATMRYCILMSNSGSATATSITATDNIPADVTYVPGSMRSGAGCGSATTVEDDNAVDDLAGAPNDESDPFGASIAGTMLTATATTLGPAATFALTFQAIVD